ncbi:MAG: hypothetical protein V7606_3036 [Burkholderiales bacterium]|jgi:hypothetical protein
MCKLLLTVVLLAAPCFAAAIGDWQALDTKLEENMHRVHDEAKEDLARAKSSGNENAELDALYRMTRATHMIGTDMGDGTNERGLSLARKTGSAEAECWFMPNRDGIPAASSSAG